MRLLVVIIIAANGCENGGHISIYVSDMYNYAQNYKAGQTLADAVALQAQGEDMAIAELRKMANLQKDDKSMEVFVLCRMLFVANDGEVFRAPYIGAGYLRGSTPDWRLTPVEIIDGVPFIVVTGCNVNGKPESPEQYLNYCVYKCHWSGYQYKIKSREQMTSALDILLHSKNWSPPLNDRERLFFQRQVN